MQSSDSRVGLLAAAAAQTGVGGGIGMGGAVVSGCNCRPQGGAVR
jgi:hypothetical protein